ncbi:COP9 signalosome complex subunit 4 [Colletotrichum fructicola]|uniref:COP9 signalosome complex subunit 4 n=1 Tax=Colletotrichum fructicola (strain Nara gc5) TaxID=1213859 RepID=A0A7J6JSF6_COLFN|nr:COP9 signalosome complex subunit 4 [Colletotrichum fructicola]KAE9579012.1 COP9 signalosome complex subunit 4 [Colletotrichum fructicola]KAF4423403.1 COP9 signalosome complex subunit 4 [Colletotrichum fructicola]KAF4492947.1 COP9 signalosome complex subunit 4 [Colletotrichum fructicola Nara gc5]
MAPSQKVAERLAQAASAGDKAAAYEAIIADIKNLSSPPTITSDLNAVLDAFFAASLGIVSTRAVLTTFVKVLRDLKNDDLWIAVGTHTLSQLSAQPSSFLDQAAAVRELVAEAHENNEDFLDAAKSLAEIPLDGSQRKVTNDDKARVWVRIARNYLEVDDTTAAETYVNKLKNIMHTVQDRDLDLHFKLSQARILDSKRDFLGASNRYHEISLSPAIAEEERLHTLSMAVKCAILAPAGPMRSRALGKLYKDERSAGLDEFGMLEKMFFDRLLAPAEVEKFAQGLQPHQLATTADGSTVLAKAVVEHNLLGASRLYRNIGFEALGSLLGLDGEKAEETTARMIEQGRLLGRIDQLEEVIWFEGGEASGQKGSGRAEVTVGKEMRQWDANVQSMAEEVENVTNALQKQFPEFVEANLVV